MICTFSYTGAVDSFTVPAGVTQVTIVATGAAGGGAGGNGSSRGASGGPETAMRGTFSVSGGQVLHVIVGQGGAGARGQQSGGGGGGGSFVFDDANNPMIASGGGGGGAFLATGGSATLTTTGGTGAGTGGAGGTNGAGGGGGTSTGAGNAGGGGGTTSAGTDGTNVPGSGGGQTTATSGGAGGNGGGTTAAGGFGGGGAGNSGGGGGGGYSGGGGGGGDTFTAAGGGGASFNNGTNQRTATVDLGGAGGLSVGFAGRNGSVTISYQLAITSPDTTSFNVDSSGTFTVMTTGSPIPTISETGSLPNGVNFTDNGDGTASISGTPTWGTSGTASDGSGQSYPFTITASNGVSADYLQSFTLVVDPPSQSWSATPPHGSSITVNDTTDPSATIIHPYGSPGDGKVPNNLSLSFSPGQVLVFGFAAKNSGGTYHLKLVADSVTQYVNVIINQAPVMAYPPNGATVGAKANTAFSQPWSVSAPATRWPHITQPVTITPSGLPTSLNFIDNGNGTGTITGTLAQGTYGPITITATNSAGSSSTSFFIKSQ